MKNLKEIRSEFENKLIQITKGRHPMLKIAVLNAVSDLFNQLEVLSQELPVIPKFVAEFLIGKEDYMLYELFDDEWLYEEHDRVAEWLYDNDELTNKQREIDLVMARDSGYLVEEEQKYYVYLDDGQYLVSEDELKEHYAKIRHEEDIGFSNYVLTFTEQEIKDYDERYWPFAVKVEELKE